MSRLNQNGAVIRSPRKKLKPLLSTATAFKPGSGPNGHECRDCVELTNSKCRVAEKPTRIPVTTAACLQFSPRRY